MRVEEEDLKSPAVTIRPGDPCFHCGNAIAGAPYIIWQGSDQNATQIGLHEECAEKLSAHLHADAQPRH